MLTRKHWSRCQILALAVFVPVPVLAQTAPPAYPPGAVVQPVPVVDPLAANLKILAQNPYDVNALTQAGIGALEVGDPQAAIGFLARAEELSPNDYRIKAALGSALTQVERPQEALRTFASAVSLGYPERMVAKDRGLAFDLIGDQKKAQKDYALAEKQGYDAEVVRRHALSLGISGERDAALKLLDPLIRRSDQSAWRARAFILALNGDMPQADRIIRAATPASMMGSMSAFLRRLPSLTLAQRASAVNFGTIPTTGPIYAAAEPTESFRSVGNGQTDGLLSGETPRVQTATVGPQVREPTRSERRAAERRNKDLAKLARRGAAAAGTPPAPAYDLPPAVRVPAVTNPVPPAPPPAETRIASVSQRVGQRIGPVDPARLPPEARADSQSAAAVSRPVLVTGAQTLPPPDTARVVRPVPASLPQSPPLRPVVPPPPPPPPPPSPPLQTVAQPVASPVVAQASAPSSIPATAPLPSIIPPATSAVSSSAPPPVPASAPAVINPAPGPVLDEKLPPAPVLPVELASVSGPTSVAGQSPTPVVAVPAQPPSLSATLQPPGAIQAQPPASPVSTAPVAGPPVSLANPPSAATTAPPAPGPGFTPEPPAPEPVQLAQAEVSAPVEPKQVVPRDRLGSLLEGVTTETETAAAPMPTNAELRAQRLAALRKIEAEAKAKADKEVADKAEKDAATKKAEEATKAEAAKLKANPARIWVQVATGANKSGLPFTWRKLREEAPKALNGIGAWYAPFRATHRLLVGPMKSQGEARQLVTALSREGVAATTWSSEAGQEVTKLAGR